LQGFSLSCPEKGNARTIAFKLGWSSQLDERFNFETGDGSRNSPFEVKGFATDVGFMIEKIKENYFVFIKRKDKRYRYEDELGSKKIATIPWQRR
jgi:hypothetical protein